MIPDFLIRNQDTLHAVGLGLLLLYAWLWSKRLLDVLEAWFGAWQTNVRYQVYRENAHPA